MELHVSCVLAALAACCAWSAAQEYTVLTDSGLVCGASDPSGEFAYFLGVPYAKQPTGELRFQDIERERRALAVRGNMLARRFARCSRNVKELQRPEKWQGCLDATKVGPVCPQQDVFYRSIMNPRGQSEECIHANVYVPLPQVRSRARGECPPQLPVLVYVHGGGFDFGSGDPDAHGPEYLVNQNVLVITFNYRVGVFGFLSLNSSSIPGNAGLRDMVTLLRWVQRNAKAFGGDPNDVTLAGQSAGGAAVHLLSLSNAAQGLFKRAILMSGAASRGFFTTSPAYAQMMSEMFLSNLGINGTDPEEAHRKLVNLPLETIMYAHNQIQNASGLITFTPVVESEHPDVERILDGDPEALQAEGRGKHIPFIIGFTNAECQTFRPRFEEIDIVKIINKLPVLVVPPVAIYTTLPEKLPSKVAAIYEEYFSGSLDMENYLKFCSDSFFIYPALKLAETRAANGGAAVFLYRFAYNAAYSVYKEQLGLKYRGAGHSEDLTFVFRSNFALANTTVPVADRNMTKEMTTYFTNFMRHSKPTMCNDGWSSVSPARKECAQYNNIVNPGQKEGDLCRKYRRLTKFFDSIYAAS